MSATIMSLSESTAPNPTPVQAYRTDESSAVWKAERAVIFLHVLSRLKARGQMSTILSHFRNSSQRVHVSKIYKIYKRVGTRVKMLKNLEKSHESEPWS